MSRCDRWLVSPAWFHYFGNASASTSSAVLALRVVNIPQLVDRRSNNVDQLLVNVALIQKQHVTQHLLNFWSGKQQCCSTPDHCRLTISTY